MIGELWAEWRQSTHRPPAAGQAEDMRELTKRFKGG